MVFFFFVGDVIELKKYEVVKENGDFDHIIHTGKSIKNHYYHIYYKDSSLSYPRFGLAVSKKFGGAVERNKMKRQLRSLIDHHKNEISNDKNYIIMVRKGIKELSYSQMEEQLVLLLKKGFLNEKN